MTSTKEYYDEHVMNGEKQLLDWNDMNEMSSTTSQEPVDPSLGPGNLLKWSWRSMDGTLPHHVAKRIYEKGVRFSSTPDLVNPYTGQNLNVKLTQLDNPYYVVTSNHGKDPAYVATTCPQEYVAIMRAYSSSFVEHTNGYKHWEERVAAYNKKYPKNQF